MCRRAALSRLGGEGLRRSANTGWAEADSARRSGRHCLERSEVHALGLGPRRVALPRLATAAGGPMGKSKVPVIRNLYSPYDGPRIAAAEWDTIVSIWDLRTRKRVSIF